ncbi:DoxX family protein [Streptacidiphilus carbonis]|uniref:DoxX family protein n=1 Tax=Streptacidiphilus carbonis TaxID=105422 RepID=UPI000A039F29|nr:DoxX family protein [Streptacidiphilus carbonis]
MAGAVGLVSGLWLWPLGVTAAVALLLMLVGAVLSHLRAKDVAKALVPAVLFAVVALAVLLLRLATS